MQEALRWAEAAWNRNGTYRRGCQRISRFFITKILYSEVDDEEQEKWTAFHKDSNFLDTLAVCGDDRNCYGNSFTVTFHPFYRFLVCPKCKTARLIQHWDYTFRNLKFYPRNGCTGYLPNTKKRCQYTGELTRVERRCTDEKKFHVVRLSPHNMRIDFNPFSHDVRYVYRIPAQVQRAILDNDPLHLHHTPWEMIETVHDGKLFEFNPGTVFHMKNDTLAGVVNLGWGLPDVLSNLGLIDRIQILNMHDEAIALDYIIPLRLITPAVASGQTGDPIRTQNLANFSSNISKFIRQRRRDPASWFALPFPVEYQFFGGEGKEMSPAELKTLAMDELLNATGIPADLYKGNLQLQGAPMSIRLFMQSWSHLINGYVGMLNWHAQIISDALRWDKPKLDMQLPTIADDIEKKQIQLQFAAANKISMGSAFEPIGLDYKRELDKRFEEQKMEMEAQKKFQDDIANQQAQGELSPSPSAIGAMGGPQGSGGPGFVTGKMSPRDVQEQATSLAQTLVNPQMSLSQRRQMLSQIRQSSETLYALVKSKMSQIRQEAGSAGRDQILSQ